MLKWVSTARHGARPFPLGISLNLQNSSEKQALYHPPDSAILDLTSCSFSLLKVTRVSSRAGVQAQVHLASKGRLLPRCLWSTRDLGWGSVRASLHHWFCSHRSYRLSSAFSKVPEICLSLLLKTQAPLHFRPAPCCSSLAWLEDKIYTWRESGFIASGRKTWYLQGFPLALLFTIGVTLGRWLNLFMPQFPHL